MKTSDQVNELFSALALATEEMEPAKADAMNKHLGAEYATLSSLHEVYRKPCAKHKLILIQTVSNTDDAYFLTTRLAHGSGQWLEETTKVIHEKNTMQALGAAVTYAKRQAISSILGISMEMDEGKVSAVEKKQEVRAQAQAAAVAMPRVVKNHATGEARASTLEAAKNPTTGAIGVTNLVKQMNADLGPPSTWPSWDHKFTFGKYLGKTIRDVGYTNAKEYLKWLETEANGKKLSPSAEMLKQALASI